MAVYLCASLCVLRAFVMTRMTGSQRLRTRTPSGVRVFAPGQPLTRPMCVYLCDLVVMVYLPVIDVVCQFCNDEEFICRMPMGHIKAASTGHTFIVHHSA